GGVVGDQQGARVAEGYGVFETGFAKRGSGDFGGESDGAGGVDAGLEAEVVGASVELNLRRADGFTLSRHFNGSRRGARVFQRNVDREALPAEDLAGESDGFEQ